MDWIVSTPKDLIKDKTAGLVSGLVLNHFAFCRSHRVINGEAWTCSFSE
jgi:hypothetical protein